MSELRESIVFVERVAASVASTQPIWARHLRTVLAALHAKTEGPTVPDGSGASERGSTRVLKGTPPAPATSSAGPDSSVHPAGLTSEPSSAGLPDIELVSAAAHAAWMEAKRAAGFTTRKSEAGEELMVPYADLSEPAKDLDRSVVKAIYAAIRAAMKGEQP